MIDQWWWCYDVSMHRLSRARDFADRRSLIWVWFFVRSLRYVWTTSPPRLLIQSNIWASFWTGNLHGYRLVKLSKVPNSILVFQFAKNDGSCHPELAIIKIRLNTISSESTDPIRVLKAVPRRVLAWLSTARTLRTIGIEFGLSTSQKSQFMHPDLISVKRYQNTEIHIRFYKM